MSAVTFPLRVDLVELEATGSLDVWRQMASRRARQDDVIASERRGAAQSSSSPARAGSLRPSPARDCLDLVNALARAEWGPLDRPAHRGMRAALQGLAAAMFDAHTGRVGELTITGDQLAQRISYTKEWTHKCLRALEALGVIEWRRGGVVDGRPVPGVFRIVKDLLCDWIEAARRRHDERQRIRNQATYARLRRLIFKTLYPHPRRSRHVEVTSTLSPYRGRKGAAGSPIPSTPTTSTKKEKQMSQITLDLKKRSTLPPSEFMPMVCGHGASDPRFCNQCRYKGWTNKQDADHREAEEAARKCAEQRRNEQADEEAKASAFMHYMRTTYPNARRNEWINILATDPTAKELANA